VNSIDQLTVFTDLISSGLLLGIFWKMGKFTAWMDAAETRLKGIEVKMTRQEPI